MKQLYALYIFLYAYTLDNVRIFVANLIKCVAMGMWLVQDKLIYQFRVFAIEKKRITFTALYFWTNIENRG